jgi:hypothetical protein
MALSQLSPKQSHMLHEYSISSKCKYAVIVMKRTQTGTTGPDHLSVMAHRDLYDARLHPEIKYLPSHVINLRMRNRKRYILCRAIDFRSAITRLPRLNPMSQPRYENATCSKISLWRIAKYVWLAAPSPVGADSD